MKITKFFASLAVSAMLIFVGCGGGSMNSSPSNPTPPPTQTGNTTMAWTVTVLPTTPLNKTIPIDSVMKTDCANLSITTDQPVPPPNFAYGPIKFAFYDSVNRVINAGNSLPGNGITTYKLIASCPGSNLQPQTIQISVSVPAITGTISISPLTLNSTGQSTTTITFSDPVATLQNGSYSTTSPWWAGTLGGGRNIGNTCVSDGVPGNPYGAMTWVSPTQMTFTSVVVGNPMPVGTKVYFNVKTFPDANGNGGSVSSQCFTLTFQ